MKTKDLIEVLSTNLEPADSAKPTRLLRRSLIAAAGLAIGTAVLALGLRPDLAQPSALEFLTIKLAFGAAVVGIGSFMLAKIVRPAGERDIKLAVAAIPFLILLAVSGLDLFFVSSAHMENMVLEKSWLECLISIPTIAVVPFAAVMWGVRQGAPTALVKAGAAAGLIAGGLSALGYALHCTADSVPFIALWYGTTVVLCTVAGALLGPRLLRW